MSRSRNMVRLLTEARPGRLDPEPGPINLTAITASPPEAPGRRSTARSARRRRLLTVGLVPTVAAGALAVAAVVAQPAVPTPAPGQTAAQQPPTARQPGTVREMLLAAAEQVGRSPATSGRYWVRKVEDGEVRQVGPARAPYNIVVRVGLESWLATDPSDKSVGYFRYLGAAPVTAADEAAWRRAGSPARWTQPGAKGLPPVVIEAAAGPATAMAGRPMPPGSKEFGGASGADRFLLGGSSVTVAELSALPTDPAALRAHLLTRRTETGSRESTTQYLFWTANSLVLDLPVTPRLRATAYRMIADLDGVTTLGTVTDRAGRTGVAVALNRRADGGNLVQTRLIVDLRTGQALAEESWDLGTGGSGRLVHSTLVTSAGWTDEAPPTRG